jgi:NADH oxidase (H2O2-forming)
MSHYDVVVIGASAAGTTAATTARKFYPDKTIAVITAADDVLIPCGIPYIFGTVGDSRKNLIPVDKIMAANKIDLMKTKVVSIDREKRLLKTSDGTSVGYERLVLATGSKPVVPPIKGADKDNVFAIWKDVVYLDAMKEALDKAERMAIIGGGFIGAEMAEESRKRRPDMPITIVEMQDHCLQLVYDPELCQMAEAALREEDITIMTQERVEEILGDGKVTGLRLASGKTVHADLVLLGIGAVPNTELATSAGLELDGTRAIAVDRYMQTSDPAIFACGDCAGKVSFFDKSPSGLRLASIATMEARIAGANLFGHTRSNQGVVGCFSTVLNKSAYAAAGLTYAQATEKGYDVVVGEAKSINRHPGVMEGAAMLDVKLLFERGTGTILGGQIQGALSGGELINAVSAFISNRMNATDIALFQAGTHPALTASPIAYQLVNAAENALMTMRS